MDDLKSAFAKNVSDLRNINGMTQLELAEKLNYSDKAVSKWERGESIPDISVVMQIADIFGVSVDYLLSTEHTEDDENNIRKMREAAADAPRVKKNHAVIIGMSVLLVWLIATTVFVVLNLTLAPGTKMHYIAFAWAVPISLIVWLVLNSVWFNPRLNFIIVSLLMWSLLACIHLTLLKYFNLWMIFLIGIPGQVIILLWSMLRFREDDPKKKDGKDGESVQNTKTEEQTEEKT